MKIFIDWELFKLKYLLENRIFVKEFEDKWILLTVDDTIKVVCEKYKSENSEDNIMFTDKHLAGKDIIKVLTMEGFEEVEPEELEEVEEEEFETKIKYGFKNIKG